MTSGDVQRALGTLLEGAWIPAETNVRQTWPRISVVTVARNSARFIDTTIRSVLNQGYPDLEYVIIDGASDDGTVDIIQRYSQQLAFWRTHPDRGPADALNIALHHCSGDLFAYLNADDMYLPGALHAAANFLCQPESVDVLLGDGYLCDPGGSLLGPVYCDPWSSRKFALGAVALFQPGSFYRLQSVRAAGGFNPENKTCWDAELLLELALGDARMKLCRAPLAVFREHPASISGQPALQRRLQPDMDRLFERAMGRPRTLFDRWVSSPALRLWRYARHPLVSLQRLRTRLARSLRSQ